MTQAFQEHTIKFAVNKKSIPVEASRSMGTAKQYHISVCKASHIVKTEAPDPDRDVALQTGVKAINYRVGPNGLTPTLLVYGALPQLGLPSEPHCTLRVCPHSCLTESYNRGLKVRCRTLHTCHPLCHKRSSSMWCPQAPFGSHVLLYVSKTDR